MVKLSDDNCCITSDKIIKSNFFTAPPKIAQIDPNFLRGQAMQECGLRMQRQARGSDRDILIEDFIYLKVLHHQRVADQPQTLWICHLHRNCLRCLAKLGLLCLQML